MTKITDQKVELQREVWGVLNPEGWSIEFHDTRANAREDLKDWAAIWHPRKGSIARYVLAETQKMEDE